MNVSAEDQDFSITQKVLHWLIGLAIMFDLFIAQKFGGVMTDIDRFDSRNDHASLGTLVAFLFVVRVFIRIKRGTPALPNGLPRWQTQLAHAMHWALYVLIGLLIVSGIGSAINANSIVSPFGAFDYGDGVKWVFAFDLFRAVHEFSTKAIMVLIVIHVLAALYHVFSKHRFLTVRMLRFWRSEKSSR
ncbi:MAG: cytochrome b/b6 domain-containing protein [Pseudomonadota bacterium]